MIVFTAAVGLLHFLDLLVHGVVEMGDKGWLDDKAKGPPGKLLGSRLNPAFVSVLLPSLLV